MNDTLTSIEQLRHTGQPFILADHQGLILEVNDSFEQVYGWDQADLVAKPLSVILPDAFKLSHHLGFSRFQVTEESKVLNHPLRLRTVCSSGAEVVSEHYIVAEKSGDYWCFGATLTPLPEGTPPTVG
ncbi:PAS domain S-box protein [Synechococcus sp. CS-1328]|uniref:PAS domain S-box protein n=1 Tax=Synechococcus sp. CS-1328 TaxID=2847976 RepID=UPI00223B29EC|nr:PAS domain S-box protein [Synechococcus sp. CS-1328]